MDLSITDVVYGIKIKLRWFYRGQNKNCHTTGSVAKPKSHNQLHYVITGLVLLFLCEQAAKNLLLSLIMLMMFTCEADTSKTCLLLELSCVRHFETECVRNTSM